MRQWCVGLSLLLVWAGSGLAMDVEWTRMTGQHGIECAPVLADTDGDGQQELVAVNEGGQVLVWSLDGAAVGGGQDGAVAQLPEGRWSSAPTLVESGDGPTWLFCDTKGLVVALDRDFQEAWRLSLPGETTWARATPLVVEAGSTTRCFISDHSGTVTCFRPDGTIVWSQALGKGACKTYLQKLPDGAGETGLLVPVGSTLCCLDVEGTPRWEREVRGEMLARPEVLSVSGNGLIVGAAGEGSLFALTVDGELAWEAPIGDEVDATIVFVPRENQDPLVVCTGLWGNLHAFEPGGQRAWTHVFRAKVRARPLVFDADRDGDLEILVATYHQHCYLFDHRGRLLDDTRLSGSVNAPPVALPGTGTDPPDVLLLTSYLLAYRLRPAVPRAMYGPAPSPSEIAFTVPSPSTLLGARSLIVRNPAGGLVRVNVAMVGEQAGETIRGAVTARSLFEIPCETNGRPGDFRAVAEDARGRLLAEVQWTAASQDAPAGTVAADALTAWRTPAFGTFDDTRLAPLPFEYEDGRERDLAIETLYRGEADQGAFVIASTHETPMRVRVVVDSPKRGDGLDFAGPITLREVVMVGSVNGERVPDALPELGDAGLVTLPPLRSAKIWVGVETGDAPPGEYEGRITVLRLDGQGEPVEMALRIEVLDLAMAEGFPLTVCTWDYLPNNWFPRRTETVLSEMGRHGVNVFPRGTIPSARVDDGGVLSIDWTPLEAELLRLEGRGAILFQVVHPPITYARAPDAAAKRQFEIAYLHAFRDFLAEHGWTYQDYAFYPVDEPGLARGKRVPTYVEAAELFRSADPRFQVYTDPVQTLSWEDFERIEPLVDVWCPNMRFATGLIAGDPRMSRIVESGKTVWSYECVSQVKSLSPLRYNRANAWRAYLFGFTGIGFWTHSTAREDLWIPGEHMNAEFALVYPGAMPVPSVRWEAVRDGLEDVAAMALLEHRIEVRRRDGTALDPVEEAAEALRIARTDIAELSDLAFVESRDFLRPGDRRIWHTWSDVEAYGLHRKRIADLTLALAGG